MANAARILLASTDKETPVFNLQAYAPIGDNHFSAVFSSTKRSRSFGFEDYADKVLTAFDGKVSLVANSLFRSNQDLFRGILAPNNESKRYEEDKLKEQGFRATAADLFTDNNQNIWKLVGEGDQKQLIRVTSEDYDRLLRARRSSLPILASADDQVNPQFGDYAYAYIPELRACDFGVYGKNKGKGFIISRRHKKKFTVDNAQVLEAAASDPALRQEMTRKWDGMQNRKAAFAEYLEFIAMLYGKNSDYYKANEDVILRDAIV